MEKRFFASLACALFLAVALTTAASANSAAPNPVLTVKVKNPPAEAYTMVLLDEKGEEYTQGDLEGFLVENRMLHRFYGMRLPREFRIAITDESGQVTSQKFSREAYYTTIVYDYAANRISYITPVWLAYVVQFLCTCIPTLLIEGAILLLFRFEWRKNWKLFLCVNLVTQILLTAAMAGHYIGSGDRGYPEVAILFIEIPIFIVEYLVYSKWLQGHSKVRRGAYALCANTASMVFGLAANSTIFALLQRL